jgi:hypothetical protein
MHLVIESSTLVVGTPLSTTSFGTSSRLRFASGITSSSDLKDETVEEELRGAAESVRDLDEAEPDVAGANSTIGEVSAATATAAAVSSGTKL